MLLERGERTLGPHAPHQNGTLQSFGSSGFKSQPRRGLHPVPGKHYAQRQSSLCVALQSDENNDADWVDPAPAECM